MKENIEELFFSLFDNKKLNLLRLMSPTATV